MMTAGLNVARVRRGLGWAVLLGVSGMARLVSAQDPAQSTDVVPPALVKSVEPRYPEGEAARAAEVVLLVTVNESGEVSKVGVSTSGGTRFDVAAIEAVLQWKFAPATRAGQAIVSEIRVPISFAPLPVDVPPGPADPAKTSEKSPPAVVPSASGVGPAVKQGAFLDVTVAGTRRPTASTGSQFVVELGKLRVIPRKNAAEQLMMAPGVLTTNHGGEGHAHETFMRGFASKEGQDIEYLVDGLPVNDVSNPHGHGYGDLNFIPPEFVRSVRITEGPFDPSQGDFAFAGSADYRLGVDERGANLTYGRGLRNTERMLLSYAPHDAHRDTFAGFELYRTDGYGTNRAAQRAIALGRYSGVLKGSGLTWRLSAFGHVARFDQPGVVRQDDFQAGRVGFFGSYDPNQGGESSRTLLAFDTVSGSPDRRLRQVTWIGWRDMRLRVNFTGWLTDSSVGPDGKANVQRGDGLEMRYTTVTAGSRGSYDLSTKAWSLPQVLSLGYAFRFDRGSSSQFRVRSVTAIPYSTSFDDEFSIMNLGGWIRAQVRPLDWLAFRGGVRIDGFSFGVTDLNQPLADREGVREPTQTSQSFGYVVNPRVTMDAAVWRDLHWVSSYGQGTRSTEASALSDNEAAPFARAQVVETGLVHDVGFEQAKLRLKSHLNYVYTHVDKDMLFDPVAGRNILFSSAGSSQPIGPSTRHAVLASTRIDYADWLDTLVNIGWTTGTLDETGEQIPYIPELVARVDAGVRGRVLGWRVGGVPVIGRAGMGATYVPGRPLPYQTQGDDYYLVNLAGDIRLWHISPGIEIRNLLNLQYREAEFNYASNFRGPQATLSQRPVRHFTAGEPFYLMATATLHLEDMIGASSDKSTPEPTSHQEEED